MNDQYSNIEKQIKKMVAQKIVPGVSYAIIDHEKIIKKVLGKAEIKPQSRLLRPKMTYDVASLTKVVGTEIVISQLVEAGKLSYDQQVVTILPNFFDSRITIRHLLTHTSGITGYIPHRNELSTTALLKALFTLEIGPDFNQKVVYSDLNYIFLGLIVERILHTPVQAAITEHVLKPLNLFHSEFDPDPLSCVPTEWSDQGGLIQGTVHDPKAQILGAHCGSAGLFSTLDDLTKFVNWLLHPEMNTTVLKSETVKQLFKNQTANPKLIRSFGWGLIEQVDDGNGHWVLKHSGFTGTMLLVDATRQQGLIFLSNRVHPTADNQIYFSYRQAVIDAFLQTDKN
ncbi:serine hydrolase domain-containing protein [Pediococcus ethanolidurans]|uniref:Beta-lactamase family protein n=1 Tax=Pediococcus ethanolidurans TaxID=319653 RepID=A0A0R2K1W6_9LACO|nr:serine hydrolase domain-containing protein [Pediococcus ethanolidurans]KRN81798.1 beta-lactamase family protein [Pediococcus ethanolidurans]GEN95671.1 serine hydrolase [Pediococcus ethanolidurans]SER81096.1 CubicO group peptidase, beta-lactamase class C family [Pediococcus ethanolidurans]